MQIYGNERLIAKHGNMFEEKQLPDKEDDHGQRQQGIRRPAIEGQLDRGRRHSVQPGKTTIDKAYLGDLACACEHSTHIQMYRSNV